MRPVLLAVLVWFQYVIVTVNYRAVAQARYGATLWTDALIAFCGFTVFKAIAESQSVLDMVGYIIGGCLGGVTGIYVTKHWKAE